MARNPVFAALLVCTLALPLGGSAGRADLGPLEPVADLHRAVRDSLGLPEPKIVELLERGLPEPELPAVGWIAEHARVPVDRVIELRRSGLSYVDVTLRLGIGPEIFFVPFEVDPGPPYGNAWGHFRKTPRDQWRTIRLTDVEVVHLANLGLCTRHYKVSAKRVLELERGGQGVASLHRELGKGRGKVDAVAHPGKGKGGKSKDKASGKSKKPGPKPPR